MNFSKYLIEIRTRAGLSLAELAVRAEIHVTTLYKAETGVPVKWRSIRKIYGPLMSSENENTKLLMLWAIHQDQGETKLEMVDEEMAKARELLTRDVDERAIRISKLISQLQDQDRVFLELFCELYSKNENTRTLAKTWTEEVTKQRNSNS